MVNLGSAIAQGATIAITIKAIDDFSNTFRSANVAFDTLSATFKVGAVAIGAATSALAAVGVSSAKAAIDFEQTQVAFTTMLGSAEEASDFLNNLADFAKRTPFTLQGVEGAAKQLMAVGFAADEVIPTLKSVGDVASGLGLGEEGLQRLILNLGQVRNQGKLTGRELRDFAVAGVPLLDELAKQLGVTTMDIQEMVSAGEISTAMVTQAFQDMTSEGGKFADLMSKQSETVAGKISNIKDTISLLNREIGEAMLPGLTALADSFLNEVLPALEPMIPRLVEIFTKVMELATNALPGITNAFIYLADIFLNSILPAFQPVLDLFQELANDPFFNDTLKQVLSAIAPIIETLAQGFANFIQAILPLMEPITELIGLFTELFVDILNQAMPILTDLIIAIIPIIKDMMSRFKELVPVLLDIAKSLIDKLVPYLPKLVDLFFKVVDVALALFTALEPLIEPLLDLAFIIFDALLAIIQPLLPSFQKLVLALVDVLDAVMPLLMPLIDLIALFLELGGKIILDGMVSALKILTPALEVVAEVLGFIVGIVEKAVGWFGKLFGVVSKGSNDLNSTTNTLNRTTSGTSSNRNTSSMSAIQSQVGQVPGFIYPDESGVIRLNDFIVTKSGKIIETNPNDNLIGVQDMGSLGGGQVVVNIDKIYGVDAEDISRALQKRLNDLIRR